MGKKRVFTEAEKEIGNMIGRTFTFLRQIQEDSEEFRDSLGKAHAASRKLILVDRENTQKYLAFFENYVGQAKLTEDKYRFCMDQLNQLQGLITNAEIEENGEQKFFKNIIKTIIQPKLDLILKQLEVEKKFPEVVSAQTIPLTTTKTEAPKKKPINDKIKLDLTPKQYSDIIDHLIDIKRITSVDKKLVQNAYYNNKNERFIIWKGNANILLTILYDLKRNGFIDSHKNVIARWLVKYFRYETNNKIKEFKFGYIYAALNDAGKKKRVHRTNSNYIDVIALIS